MKKQLLLSILVVWTQGSLAGEPRHQTVESSIESVVVFSDRAMVKRIFSAACPTGFSTVEIPDLPSKMIDESIRVSGKGTSGATILGVRIEEKHLESTVQDKVRELEEEINVTEKQISILNDRKDVLNQKRIFVEAISRETSKSIGRDVAIQRPSVTEWSQMVGFVEEIFTGVTTELRSIEEEKKGFENRKSALNQEMQKYKQSKSTSIKAAFVELDVKNPGSFTLELSYIVMGASWSPVYDIRVLSDTNIVDIILQANIRQNTGEDWENVAMELSTARPVLGARPPAIKPLYVNIVYAGEKGLSSFRAGRTSLEKGKVTYQLNGVEIEDYLQGNAEQLGGMLTQNTATQVAIADVSAQPISTSFILKQAESISSNNIPKKVSVKVASAAAKQQYFAVPRLAEHAYLKARITNETSFPLLAGNASVFFDGNFVGTTRMPLAAPSESFDLFLGVDEAIKIDRRLVEKYVDKTGVLNKKNRTEYRYEITVENFRKDDIKITILDQIPVSQNDQIEVKLTKISLDVNPEGNDEEKGMLRWVMNLKPSSKTELGFSYEMKYPAGIIMAGVE